MRERERERRKTKRRGKGGRPETIQETLAHKNALLGKKGQMHTKCINFAQVNAIVNTVEYTGLIVLLYWHTYHV